MFCTVIFFSFNLPLWSRTKGLNYSLKKKERKILLLCLSLAQRRTWLKTQWKIFCSILQTRLPPRKKWSSVSVQINCLIFCWEYVTQIPRQKELHFSKLKYKTTVNTVVSLLQYPRAQCDTRLLPVVLVIKCRLMPLLERFLLTWRICYANCSFRAGGRWHTSNFTKKHAKCLWKGRISHSHSNGSFGSLSQSDQSTASRVC